MFQSNCRCCQNFLRTGDFFHDKESWDLYHNGRLHNDWQPREEIQDLLERMKEFWEKSELMLNKEPNEVNLKIIKAIGDFTD